MMKDKGTQKEAAENVVSSGDDYSFLQEKIKERPINKKKLVKQSLTTIALAVVFGLIASFIFFLLEPAISRWISPEEEQKKVVLPEEQDELLPEEMVFDDTQFDVSSENVTPNISNAISTVDLQISDYQSLVNKLSAQAGDTQRCLVTVKGVNTDVDWFLNQYQTGKETPGLIITDNEEEIFVLTYQSILDKVGEVKVIFNNGEEVEATIKAVDSGTGLAVVSVPLASVSSVTKEKIQYAKFGSSNNSDMNGKVVMALGSPLGNSKSLGYGIVTSYGNEVNAVDYNYKLITTDIYGSRNAAGFLFDTKGQVIGVINQNYNSSDVANLISAMGISELRSVIENLSNKKTLPEAGLYITDVTEDAIKDLGIPDGVYVTAIKMESPGMFSGIRGGDIIVSVDDVVVTSVYEYRNELLEHMPGDTVSYGILRLNGTEYAPMNISITYN